jgi:NADPH2:quinone reductase
MQRVVVERWVTVEELGDLPIVEVDDPEPTSGSVVVDVEAANITYVDGLMCTGGYQFKPPLPFTPGTEVAGTVSAVGEGVDRSRIGQRVVSSAFGGCAGKVVVPAEAAVRLPDELPAATAASMLQGYGTMHFSYTRRTRVEPGDTVVVLGAAGGVGLAAIDLAKAAGARVIACASSAEKLDIALRAGADELVDYSADGFDLKAAIRELTDGGADVVVDPVGAAFAEPALRALRFDGRYLVLGFAGGPIPKVPLNQVLLNNRTVVGIEFGGWVRRGPNRFAEITAELLDLVVSGAVHPIAPEVFPLADTGRLYHALMTRQFAGKAVVAP